MYLEENECKELQKTFLSFLQVLVEVMGHPRNSKDFLGTSPITPTSSMREVEEHYWSQVTKQDVRDLYEKYKVDHDIFGFTPEYYIAMAKPDAA